MLLLVTLFLIIFACALIYLYLIWDNDYWRKRGVLGPKPQLLFGNFRGSYLHQRHIAFELEDIYNEYRGKSPFVGVFRNKIPQLMVIDPDMIKTVLISSFANFHDNEFSIFMDTKSDPILARNPFSAHGDYWKEKRTEILPGFTPAKIRAIYPIVKDVCKQLQQYIGKQSEYRAVNTFEVKNLSEKYAADLVSNTIFGIDSEEFKRESISQMRQMGATIISYNILRYINVVNVFPFIRKFYKMTLTSKTVERFFIRLMEDSIQMRQDRDIQRDDFLNFILELKNKKNLSQMDMAGHTVTFFINGYETTSGSIAYMLYELAKNPQIQSRLRTEIKQFIEKHGEINSDNINDIQYLEQVFNETQRLHPTVALMTKVCTEPIELSDYKDKKVLIERGTRVIIPIYPIHHDAEYYPNPQEFQPERFSPENGGLKVYKDKEVFLAFGDGPRFCFGMKFAILEVKSAIIAILEKFEVSLNAKSSDGFKCDPALLFLVAQNGLWIDFKPI